MPIINPVLPGFHPDPSIIRVGETYYLATSTFEWWPGVQLYESRNLTDWTPLPSPLDRVSQLDMRGNAPSGGVWAPDLSYCDGKFWLIYSDVKSLRGPFKDLTNYLVTAENIRGPWSEPIRLNGVGFDPSLFHDTDGRKYLLQQTSDFREYHHAFNGITITEFDTDTMRLKRGSQRTLWEGTEVRVIEGPHLYRIGDWYYLFAAEGGTDRAHQESVARSRTLDGPFTVMPNNPLLSDFDDPYGPLQKQGHGSLVSTPDGAWYYASLCSRPWKMDRESSSKPGWSTLGRETAIQQVEWDADGWPRIIGGKHGRVIVEAPGETALASSDIPELHAPKRHQHDAFDAPCLGPDWKTLRAPFTNRMGETGAGSLTLYGQESLYGRFDVSMIARRWQSFRFDAQVELQFEPDTYQAMAGLANYYNDANWSWVYVTYDEKRRQRVLEISQSDRYNYRSYLREQAVLIPENVLTIHLKVTVDTQRYWYSYSFDGQHWDDIPVVLDARILSDEYVNQVYCGSFTGAFVGLAAVDMSGYRAPAKFTNFDYLER